MTHHRPRISTSEYNLIKTRRKQTIVGVIGDTHEPFSHPGYLDFCRETFELYGATKIVHIGDEVDNHALSYHENYAAAMGADLEAIKAQQNMDKWYNAFPDVTVVVGNHSALPHRKATTAGIPPRMMRAYNEIWEAPPGWEWVMDVEIDHVRYTHGTGTSGASAALNRAVRSRQSTVMGHVHSFGGVAYHASGHDIIFGMNVGCGIDVNSYAFDYGKNFVNKPTLGCGIVIDGAQAIFVPMDLGKKYYWK